MVDAFVDAGAAVVVLDRVPAPPELAAGVRWARGDVADPQWLAGVLGEVGAVVHLAGRLPQARLGAAGFVQANVTPTEVVARAAAAAGARCVVLASTIEVYGAQDMATPLDEQAATIGTGPYSWSKLRAERVLHQIGQELGVATVALRLPMILGPGFCHEPSTLAILDVLRRGWPLPVPGRGERPVSYVSAADAAQGFVQAVARTSPGLPTDGRVYNIAAADHPTMRELFVGVAAAIGSRSRVVGVPWPFVRGAVRLATAVGSRRGAVAGTPVELLPFVLTGGAYAIDAAVSDLGYQPRDGCVEAWAALYRWWEADTGKRSRSGR